MTAPWHTNTNLRDEPAAPDSGYGWGKRTTRTSHHSTPPGVTPPVAPPAGAGVTPPITPAVTPGAGDRHEIVVPVDADHAAVVPAGRVGEAMQQRVDSLRFVNLPLGSLREILQFAKHAEYNLGHIPAVRAANIAFFRVVTAPFLTAARFIEWAFLVRLHRAVTSWTVLLVVAHFLNRLFDWAVPDGLDAWTWSATTWQWVAGGLFAFVLITVLVFLRGPR